MSLFRGIDVECDLARLPSCARLLESYWHGADAARFAAAAARLPEKVWVCEQSYLARCPVEK